MLSTVTNDIESMVTTPKTDNKLDPKPAWKQATSRSQEALGLLRPTYIDTFGHVQYDHAVAVDQVEVDDAFVNYRNCPNPSNLLLVNRLTRESIPMGCNKQSCPPCCLVIAAMTATAIAMAEPTHIITLSPVDTTWADIRSRLNAWNRLMRASTNAWEACAHVHLNEGATGQHMHAFVRGSNITTEDVQTAAVTVGMREHVDIQATTRYSCFNYGMQDVFDTIDMAYDEAAAKVDQYLAINGGRLTHASRGFWLDHRGRPTTLKQARRSVMSDWQVRMATGAAS